MIETGEGPPSNGVLEMLGNLVDLTISETTAAGAQSAAVEQIETGEGPPSNGVLEMLGKLVESTALELKGEDVIYETTAESITGVQTAPSEVVTIETGERPPSDGVLEVLGKLGDDSTTDPTPQGNGVLEMLGKLVDETTADWATAGKWV